MKTLEDFNDALNNVGAARRDIIANIKKCTQEELLIKINKMEQALDSFRQFSPNAVSEELFDRYIEAQGLLHRYVKELRDAITMLNSQYSKDSQKSFKKLTEFLPSYFLVYTSSSKEVYEKFLKDFTREHFMLDGQKFKFTGNEKNLSITIQGYQLQAKELLSNMLGGEFSVHCKFETAPYSKPNDSNFFAKSSNSISNNINDVSNTPPSTSESTQVLTTSNISTNSRSSI